MLLKVGKYLILNIGEKTVAILDKKLFDVTAYRVNHVGDLTPRKSLLGTLPGVYFVYYRCIWV